MRGFFSGVYMKIIILYVLVFYLTSCGGGGSASSSSNIDSSSSSNSTLLPGSVGSFQPIDIDDWLWKKYIFFYRFAQYPYFPLTLQKIRKIITFMASLWMILLNL